MLGKIVMLHGIPMEEGYRVDYGIECNRFGIKDFVFVTFHYEYGSNYARKTYIRGGHHIENERDGFKKITLFGKDSEVFADCKDEKEDYLMVIIPKSMYIASKAEKVAGRYPDEGVWVMVEGESIEVSKGAGAPKETYMVVRGGKDLFLVKLSR